MNSIVMRLAPHERRVVVEAFELDEKIKKLDDFLKSGKADALSASAKGLLVNQLASMRTYMDILDTRLSSFELD